MSPAITVSAVVVLVTSGGKVADLVASTTVRPGLQVVWAVGMNVAHVATHGAEVVHVNDWGGG